MKRCYYCGTEVSEDEHLRVQRAMMIMCGEACDNDVHIAVAENSFVHMQGVRPESKGNDGNVVVCSVDFVRQVAWIGE